MTLKLDKITFAGHSAVFITAGEKIVAIDPWLEDNPVCPAELKNPERLDLIVLTHGHADHAADTPRLAKATGAKVAATYELANIMIAEGVPQEQVISMNKGGSENIDGIHISLTHAFHSSSYDTAKGPVYAGEACGVVISDGEFSIYHAGDTCMFSDIALIKEIYHPQIALLPIGDKFTMGPLEASLAAKMVGCSLAIPIHYKTFDILPGTAESFVESCSRLSIETKVLEPGQSHSI